MHIYDRIKFFCGERGVSVRYVESAAGLKNGAISKWNNSSPTVKSLKAVADILEVPVDELVREEASADSGGITGIGSDKALQVDAAAVN